LRSWFWCFEFRVWDIDLDRRFEIVTEIDILIFWLSSRPRFEHLYKILTPRWRLWNWDQDFEIKIGTVYRHWDWDFLVHIEILGIWWNFEIENQLQILRSQFYSQTFVIGMSMSRFRVWEKDINLGLEIVLEIEILRLWLWLGFWDCDWDWDFKIECMILILTVRFSDIDIRILWSTFWDQDFDIENDWHFEIKIEILRSRFWNCNLAVCVEIGICISKLWLWFRNCDWDFEVEIKILRSRLIFPRFRSRFWDFRIEIEKLRLEFRNESHNNVESWHQDFEIKILRTRYWSQDFEIKIFWELEWLKFWDQDWDSEMKLLWLRFCSGVLKLRLRFWLDFEIVFQILGSKSWFYYWDQEGKGDKLRFRKRLR
jgi:hypothetical protein